MAKYCTGYQGTFNNYHHSFFIVMTDFHKGSNLQFLGEYLKIGKRSDNNQPGVSGQALDKTYDGSGSIYHYFCNRAGALTGVSGGMVYRYNDVYLYIGFGNPLIKSKKAYVELNKEEHSAKWAYEQLEHRDDKISTCRGWKVNAVFESTKKPALTVKFGKEDSF